MPKRSLGSEDSDDELHTSSSERLQSPQPKKKKLVEFEPVRLCSIGSVKEIETRVLRAQHYKLCERFRHKQKIILGLEKRVEEFERRQVQDDAILCIINRYWNRLDEDVQLLLQRFDGEATQLDSEMKDESTSGQKDRHFLDVLAQWSCEEMDEKLGQRVEFSQRALAKLVQAFTRIGEQNIRICSMLKANSENSPPLETEESPGKESEVNIDKELRDYATTILEENTRLQKVVTDLQAENHRLDIKSAAHDDKAAMMELRIESLTNEIEDLRYRLHKTMRREEKLDYRLAEYVKKESAFQVSAAGKAANDAEKGDDVQMNGAAEGEELASLSKTKLEELQQELEIQTELAANRLSELQEMTERNKSLSADLENCKMKIRYMPTEDVKGTTDYKLLQGAYNGLFEDSKAQKKELDDLKQQMAQLKQSYEEQVVSIKSDQNTALERLQQTVLELDNDLNATRREYENVCVDYEVNTASKEQAGPIAEQTEALMASLTTLNTQLKQEVARQKRKCTDLSIQLHAAQKELEGEKKLNNENYLIIKLNDEATAVSSGSGGGSNNASLLDVRAEADLGTPSPAHTASPLVDASAPLLEVKKEEPTETTNGQEHKNSSCSVPSTIGEAVEIIRRLRVERDRCRDDLRTMARTDLKDKRKHWSEEQRKRQKHLEEQCEKLRRELQSAKQEEDGLMQEMESTGQAFEELQEEHRKLLDQLKEKEEINLKLMSEKIRSTQAMKKMKDEMENLEQNGQSLENQLAAKLLLCQKLEEKERVLGENRITLEHELKIRDLNNDSLRKKASEYSQLATDLRLRLERLDVQFSELRESVIKKASSYEANANKIKRLEEEKSSLKRKLERAKRMEKYENVDELLQEENRILKESLTCPSCKVNRKNAILDKCHHVFCFECIRLRYDNRRRKCPKCNAAFGSNDFHRIYLE